MMSDDTLSDEDVLFAELYDELGKLAEARMRRIPDGQTLQPTALIHEVYLRMHERAQRQWHGRAHFFAAAARAMHEILVDQMRRKQARKRGGDQRRADITVTLADDGDVSMATILALDEILTRMSAEYPEHARIVVYRYFGGLTMDEIAEVLEMPKRTAERYWRFGRAWLKQALAGLRA
jgi:RNA polymerase sigma factor (TIGR02999 family)